MNVGIWWWGHNCDNSKKNKKKKNMVFQNIQEFIEYVDIIV